MGVVKTPSVTSFQYRITQIKILILNEDAEAKDLNKANKTELTPIWTQKSMKVDHTGLEINEHKWYQIQVELDINIIFKFLAQIWITLSLWMFGSKLYLLHLLRRATKIFLHKRTQYSLVVVTLLQFSETGLLSCNFIGGFFHRIWTYFIHPLSWSWNWNSLKQHVRKSSNIVLWWDF